MNFILNSISAKSHEHGDQIVDPSHRKGKNVPGDGGEQHEAPDGDNAGATHPVNVDDFIGGLPKRVTSQLGDDDSGGGSSSDESSDDDSGDRGHSKKKQRIYESQMPWFSDEKRIRKSITNLSCNKTRDILNILRDYAAVKRWIRCAASAPAGFPSTEWDALIKGETVDINTVFSSLHHVHSIDESIGCVGSTEIQFGRPKPVAKLKRVASRPLRSTSSSKLWRSSSPIVMTSSDNMGIIWKNSSQQKPSQSILICSNTMRRSDTKSDKDKTSFLPTGESSSGTTKPSLHQMVSELKEQVEEVAELQVKTENLKKSLISAINSMEQTDVVQPPKNANTNISARNVSNMDMERWTAKLMRECEQLGRRPQYLRHNVYRDDNMMSRSCAEWTEVACPLVSVLTVEFSNTLACDTIN